MTGLLIFTIGFLAGFFAGGAAMAYDHSKREKRIEEDA